VSIQLTVSERTQLKWVFVCHIAMALLLLLYFETRSRTGVQMLAFYSCFYFSPKISINKSWYCIRTRSSEREGRFAKARRISKVKIIALMGG